MWWAPAPHTPCRDPDELQALLNGILEEVGAKERFHFLEDDGLGEESDLGQEPVTYVAPDAFARAVRAGFVRDGTVDE